MKEKIVAKLESIVDAIVEKDPGEISKDEYDILAAELRRVVYDEEFKERNKKLAETMGSMFGGFSSAY